jgi:ABC-type glycerol-3-phosphate transport system substrate-binding protein
MGEITRRAVIRKGLSLAAAGAVVRPHISRAAATTAEVWWAQGFIPEEDTALKKIAADYEKASGNKIDLVITPFAPLRQKIWQR